MTQEKKRNKRILLMTNFGAPLYPKTITEAVIDIEKDKNISLIINEIYENIEEIELTPGPLGPPGNNIYNRFDGSPLSVYMAEELPAVLEDGVIYIKIEHVV